MKKEKSGFSKGKTEVLRGFKQEDAQTPTKQAKCPINKGILRFNGRKAEKLQKPAKARQIKGKTGFTRENQEKIAKTEEKG